MGTEFEVHAVRVVGYPIYKCRTCGRLGRGTVVSLEFDCALPTQGELERTVGASYMPVHWASYGRGAYACPEHAS